LARVQTRPSCTSTTSGWSRSCQRWKCYEMRPLDSDSGIETGSHTGCWSFASVSESAAGGSLSSVRRLCRRDHCGLRLPRPPRPRRPTYCCREASRQRRLIAVEESHRPRRLCMTTNPDCGACEWPVSRRQVSHLIMLKTSWDLGYRRVVLSFHANRAAKAQPDRRASVTTRTKERKHF
jgi:hypothetical protein